MILKESELGDQDLIGPVLGKPYKEPGKFLTTTGSSYFFIKEITDFNGNPLPLKREEMKVIFQRYEKGLHLHLNKSNYQNGILIPYSSINKITLVKGKENIRKWFSPILWFLLKLGFTLNKARYFGLGWGYQINEMVLVLNSEKYLIKCVTNGFSFDSQVNYFSGLGLGNKIEIKD